MRGKEFINYLEVEKRYSAHTLSSYQSDLLSFTSFLERIFLSRDLLKVNQRQIRSWIAELSEQGISAKSIHRKASSLKSFYRYCRTRGYITHNPARAIPLPKLAKRLPKTVPIPALNYLLSDFEFPDNFSGARDRIIIELLYETGMRLSELIALKQSDINIQDRSVKVTGKGNKERMLVFSKELASDISSFLSDYREKLRAEELIQTEKGKRAYPNLVRRALYKYLGIATSSKNRNPHVLRHSFATGMLNNGAKLNDIKHLLGHESLAATQIYTHSSTEELLQAYAIAHPKGER